MLKRVSLLTLICLLVFQVCLAFPNEMTEFGGIPWGGSRPDHGLTYVGRDMDDTFYNDNDPVSAIRGPLNTRFVISNIQYQFNKDRLCRVSIRMDATNGESFIRELYNAYGEPGKHIYYSHNMYWWKGDTTVICIDDSYKGYFLTIESKQLLDEILRERGEGNIDTAYP